jgi:RimJ/RimL family protein N-acetyltransferase
MPMNLFKDNSINLLQLEKYKTPGDVSFTKEGVMVYPITWNDLNNKKIIKKLKNWRNENQIAFPKVFNATENGTLVWLEKAVLKREDRLLFLIDDIYGKTIGHIGVSSFNYEEKTCEIDNIIRGDISSQSKVMEHAVSGLLSWIFEMINPKYIKLRVFNDNTKAIALYYKLGFKLGALHPLEKKIKESETEWIDSKNKIDRFFISMELRNTFKNI